MAPNDRIHKQVEALGYCCPYGFFGCNQRRSDSIPKLAKKAGVGVSTIEFNRRKIRRGDMGCEDKANCMANTFQPGPMMQTEVEK